MRKLRDAGAVILGKSNMHELATGITTISSIGGQTCNPYDPDRDPGGSSGGSGARSRGELRGDGVGIRYLRVDSNSVGVQNLFGLRPTKGLSSIDGIVPLSHTQDVGGPLARRSRDLAIGLDATVGPDPADTATRILEGKPSRDSCTRSTRPRCAALGSACSPRISGRRATMRRHTRGPRRDRKAQSARRRDRRRRDSGLDSLINRASVIDYEFKYDLIDFCRVRQGPGERLGEILDRGLYHMALDSRSGGARPGHARRRRVSRGAVDGASRRAKW